MLLENLERKESYQQDESLALVKLVKDAAALIAEKGESAFQTLGNEGSRWRSGDNYIFVLNDKGHMLVHPDPALEDKNVIGLKDVHGKAIIRGLIQAATANTQKPEGWYHYEWPVPGGLLPRWKSSYVRLAHAPSGQSYIVGSGIYNDRMERAFVVDTVLAAVQEIEKNGTRKAFALFHDPTAPYLAKDEYVFVFDSKGRNLVLPPFTNLEGKDLIDLKDTHGKFLVREMLDLVSKKGSGWVDYMWPKPGESVSTQKSAFVTRAHIGDEWLLVGSGVYLTDAPKSKARQKTMSAAELVSLVEEASLLLEAKGRSGYVDLRRHGSKWLRNDTYFFVWTLEGVRDFHAGDPSSEGQNVRDLKDIIGRPIGRMILNTATNAVGQGWVHYMYPEPGHLFPTWKSTFVKRVVFPDGTPHLVGCGIYNLQVDRSFIEDVVNRAGELVAERGSQAFPDIRDPLGPCNFMDIYVFVISSSGTELVNPAFPSLEGRNLTGLTDLKGHHVIQEQIEAALKDGSAWLDFYWFKPGQNTMARKQTFVKKVTHADQVYIVGSGLYLEE